MGFPGLLLGADEWLTTARLPPSPPRSDGRAGRSAGRWRPKGVRGFKSAIGFQLRSVGLSKGSRGRGTAGTTDRSANLMPFPRIPQGDIISVTSRRLGRAN
jgi:hypothetical protein